MVIDRTIPLKYRDAVSEGILAPEAALERLRTLPFVEAGQVLARVQEVLGVAMDPVKVPSGRPVRNASSGEIGAMEHSSTLELASRPRSRMSSVKPERRDSAFGMRPVTTVPAPGLVVTRPICASSLRPWPISSATA